MSRRAAICIGVNRPTGMTPLTAAARDAGAFEFWAKRQGCDVTLLTDDATGSRVVLNDAYDAIDAVVKKGVYDQLIVYFSGHGILLAPGAEYWLLSRGPANPNEAVNLLRSIEDARNSGIPHVVFVSDACRSAADTPTLRAVTGGLIFPPQPTGRRRAEIDVYYATLPGDPANEVPQASATGAHRGLFTDCLLEAVSHPPSGLVESVADVSVISSRRLKDHLESTVPIAASSISLTLSQTPEVRVETALPKYFAQVPATRGGVTRDPSATPPPPAPTIALALDALRQQTFGLDPMHAPPGPPATREAADLASRLGLTAEVARLAATTGRGHFETMTGFTVHGADIARTVARTWRSDPAFRERGTFGGTVAPYHIRLAPPLDGTSKSDPASVVVQFANGTGALLPILHGFIGTIVVKDGRVVSVNFEPSAQSARYGLWAQHAARINEMKAFAAVATRNGRFEVAREEAWRFAERIRQDKAIDPIMGLYAAYAYAQVGRYGEVASVLQYLRDDEAQLAVPFDVAMLALRADGRVGDTRTTRVTPFAPMLSQGWALLMPGDAMHAPIHQRLRPHLLPAVFTTLDAAGIDLVARALQDGEIS